MTPRREGFTLIELLIVIVIMGILAAIAVSLFWRVKDRGIESSLQSDLKSVATQQEQYFMTNHAYAPNTGALGDYSGSPGVVVTVTYAGTDGWAGISTHGSIPNVRCGLIVNTAPAGAADPATEVGIVQCTSE